MRTAFVQLAFPVLPAPDLDQFGSVRVTTRWKKIKNGIVENLEIPNSVSDAVVYPIPNFSLAPVLAGSPGVEDNGDGTLTVSVPNKYLPGTFVRIGSATFSAGSPGTVYEPDKIRIVVPANQLATHDAYLVDRSGESTAILDPSARSAMLKCISIPTNGVTTRALAPTVTEVTISIGFTNSADCIQTGAKLPFTSTADIVVVMGKLVFGLRDAPFRSRDDHKVSFLVPSDQLQLYPHVTVKRLLWGKYFEDGQDITPSLRPTISQATVVMKSSTQLQVALMGSGLTGLSKVEPASMTLDPVSDSGVIVTMPIKDTENLKQLVFKAPTGELFLVATPQANPPESAKPAGHAGKGKGGAGRRHGVRHTASH